MALLLGFVGCQGPGPTEDVQRRAALDLQCPSSRITVGRVATNTYAARGCEIEAIYICNLPVRGRYRVCSMDQGPRSMSTGERVEPGVRWAGSVVQDGRYYPGDYELGLLRECSSTPRLAVQIDENGRAVNLFTAPRLTQRERDCLGEVASAHGWPVYSVARLVVEISERPLAAAEGETGPTESSATEARVREALDARARELLLCTGQDIAAIRVRTEEDSLVYEAQDGDPVQSGCVTSVMTEFSIDVPGSLDLLHVIRVDDPR
ncbi:MAG: hypothetical protein AAGF12_02040 [Myxococcota bacterium]